MLEPCAKIKNRRRRRRRERRKRRRKRRRRRERRRRRRRRESGSIQCYPAQTQHRETLQLIQVI